MGDYERLTRKRLGIRELQATLALFLVALAVAPARGEDDIGSSGWEYDAIVYSWLSGLSGDIGMGPAGSEVSASFEDLLGFVDFAMAGHFEARSSAALLVADVSYVGLGAEREAKIGSQTVDVELDTNQWILEFGGGWRLTSEFDVLLVGRYYILDTGATTESIGGSSGGGSTQNWGDVFVGARYSRYFREKWIISIRGDLGAGGSDFAWFGDVGAGYQFTERFSALASWRVLSVDYAADASDDYFRYDMTQAGLGVGARFSF